MSQPNQILPRLGTPDSYRAILTARDLTTFAGELPWSNIDWSRALDETSEASVVVPDAFGGVRCNVEFGDGVRPWRFGLRIERDDQEVWTGPITTIERPERDGIAADYVTVSAADISTWMSKRTSSQDLQFANADAGEVFKALVDEGAGQENLFDLQCPEFTTGFTMTRDVLAFDFEYIADLLSEIADSAVDYFVIGRYLVVYDAGDLGWFTQINGVKTRIADTDDPFGRYIFGLFTNDAYINRPGFTLDGAGQGNNIIIPGADSGEAGFRRFWQASDVDLNDGLLTMVDVNPLYRPQPGTPIEFDGVFQQRADSTLALRRDAPSTISGGKLSPNAPVSISGLLPGSLWQIDLADSGIGRLLDVQRLKRVDVSVTVDQSGAVIESVAPTLIPLGSDESQAA